MKKIESSQGQHYELLYIIPNKFSEKEADLINEKVIKIIKDNNGIITHSEKWGNKKLAYQIKQFNYGYYNLIEFDVNAENLKNINKTLRMSDEVLRYQIVKKQFKKAEQIEKAKKISQKIVAKNIQKQRKEEKKEIKFKTDQSNQQTGKNEKAKIELKDLDKKLDEILEAKDLF